MRGGTPREKQQFCQKKTEINRFFHRVNKKINVYLQLIKRSVSSGLSILQLCKM